MFKVSLLSISIQIRLICACLANFYWYLVSTYEFSVQSAASDSINSLIRVTVDYWNNIEHIWPITQTYRHYFTKIDVETKTLIKSFKKLINMAIQKLTFDIIHIFEYLNFFLMKKSIHLYCI